MADSLMAEFETSEGMMKAIRDLRARGYRHLDAYTPYPMPEAEEALGLARSRIPLVALVAGLLGAGAAYGIMWLINVSIYPLNVGAFPLHSSPAFIPITFEIGVLSAGVATFVAVLAAGRIPKLYDPLFEIDGFDRVNVDRFWVRVEGVDPLYEPAETERVLSRHAPLRVLRLETNE